jgi:hypothetical protein
MKRTTKQVNAGHPTSQYKRNRTKLFNVLKAIDYQMSIERDGLIKVSDISGNYLGIKSAETWLEEIKRALRPHDVGFKRDTNATQLPPVTFPR